MHPSRERFPCSASSWGRTAGQQRTGLLCLPGLVMGGRRGGLASAPANALNPEHINMHWVPLRPPSTVSPAKECARSWLDKGRGLVGRALAAQFVAEGRAAGC